MQCGQFITFQINNMIRSIFKSGFAGKNTYRISYNILVNGESYPRTIDIQASSSDQAKAEWQKNRNKSIDTEEYLFCSITQIK